MKRLAVLVVGRGKVGRALHRALASRGARARLVAARRVDREPMRAPDLVVLAVRERDIEAVSLAVARRFARSNGRVAFAHVAGSLGPEALSAVRAAGFHVAQMHPLLSFVGTAPAQDPFVGATLGVAGDAPAVLRAKRVARLLGMVPRDLKSLDRAAYHAAAALVANGAATLAAAAAELLCAHGVPHVLASRMLGPLLASVGTNLAASTSAAEVLSGPIRRGDAVAVAKHLKVLSGASPWVMDLYVAVATAQIPIARAIGEADSAALETVASTLRKRSTG